MTTLIHPVSSPISQNYGAEFYNFNGVYYAGGVYRQMFGLADGHNGIDYASPIGTRCNAAAAGTVIYTGLGDYWDGTVGGGAQVVIIDHGDILTAYLHLKAGSFTVSKGQKVAQGQQIAQTGNTGQSTGAHLHFQVMPKPFSPGNGRWGCVNPNNYIGKATEANQRVVGVAGVKEREKATTASKELRLFTNGDVLNFKGYVKGQSVSGNNIWFVGEFSGTYFHSSGFTNMKTTGLKDLTPADPKKRVTVAAGANIRATPETNGKILGVLKPGQGFTALAYTTGDSANGSNLWFRTNADYYVHTSGATVTSVSGLPKNQYTPDPYTRITVPEGANVRGDAPKTSSRIESVLKPGQKFYLEGYVEGENVNGSANWFKSTAGNYVHVSAATDTSVTGLKKLTWEPPKLPDNVRKVADAVVNTRNTPDTNGAVVKQLQPGTELVIESWTRGELVDQGGVKTDIWYQSGKTDDWAWAGAFTTQDTKGLTEFTKPEPKPEPEPEVPVDPKEVTKITDPAGVNLREFPTTAAKVIKVLPPNEEVPVAGFVETNNEVWFAVKTEDNGYISSVGVTDPSVIGLPELTAPEVPVEPKPEPEPTKPTPNTGYNFTPDFSFVEYKPAHVTNRGTGNFPAKPTHVVLHQFDAKAKRPSLDGVINHFQTERPGGETSAHFGVSGDRIVQFVSLKDRAYHAGATGNNYIGIEIDPQEDVKTVASVKRLLTAIKAKYGYLPIYTKHRDVPGNATSCGIDINLGLYELTSEVPPVVEPEKPIVDDVVTDPAERAIIERFLNDKAALKAALDYHFKNR